MTKEAIEQFIQSAGGISFPRVVFRQDPEAFTTTPFGIDTTTGTIASIRIHLGTDRGRGRYRQVFSPFKGLFTIEESSDYGTLFRLRVEDDFEVRVGHMKVEEIAVRSRPAPAIKAGELIGLAGSEGKSTGIHTHTEIVSSHGESEICEQVLRTKGFDAPWFTPEELQEKAGGLWPQLRDDMIRKGVVQVGPYKIKKVDVWTKRMQVYYDSRALFGF